MYQATIWLTMHWRPISYSVNHSVFSSSAARTDCIWDLNTKINNTLLFLFPVSMFVSFNKTFKCRLHGYWSIPYTYARSIWPTKCRIFRSDVVMQFSHVNLVHQYIENRFIIERLPIYLTGVKHFLTQTAFNMLMLSKNQTIESLRLLASAQLASLDR